MNKSTSNVAPSDVNIAIRLPDVVVRELERVLRNYRSVSQKRAVFAQVETKLEDVWQGEEGSRRVFVNETKNA